MAGKRKRDEEGEKLSSMSADGKIDFAWVVHQDDEKDLPKEYLGEFDAWEDRKRVTMRAKRDGKRAAAEIKGEELRAGSFSTDGKFDFAKVEENDLPNEYLRELDDWKDKKEAKRRELRDQERAACTGKSYHDIYIEDMRAIGTHSADGKVDFSLVHRRNPATKEYSNEHGVGRKVEIELHQRWGDWNSAARIAIEDDSNSKVLCRSMEGQNLLFLSFRSTKILLGTEKFRDECLLWMKRWYRLLYWLLHAKREPAEDQECPPEKKAKTTRGSADPPTEQKSLTWRLTPAAMLLWKEKALEMPWAADLDPNAILAVVSIQLKECRRWKGKCQF